MNDFIKTKDGSGYDPRDIQVNYFEHLDSKMSTHRIHGLSGPPGIGKSYIARTIQRTLPGTSIITTNNLLVDQYCDTYKELNAVKGKDYFYTEGDYRAAQDKAVYTPSVFNPLSFYYFHLRNPSVAKPRTVIIDEAHNLGQMLLLTINKSLQCEYYGIPKDLDDIGLLKWLDTQVGRLHGVYTKKPTGNKRITTLNSQYEQLRILRDYLKDNLKTVKTFYEKKEDKRGRVKEYLTVQPLVMPANLLTTIFGKNTRMILMSGSLTPFHLNELYPYESKIDYINYEPLAPKENAPVHHVPMSFADRRDPKAVADKIRRIYEAEGKPNTLVHVSYAFAKELKPYLKSAIYHDADTKLKQLQKFKDQGGMLIASGMAEGVDLPGDLCRLIIIPLLLFPNKGDQAVYKRLALPGGQEWYNLTTIMTTLQQCGRGVRGATDACNTFVFDPYFPNLIGSTRKYLTKGFLASMDWRNKRKDEFNGIK